MADDYNPQNAPDPKDILQGIENGDYVFGDAPAAGYSDPEVAEETKEASTNIAEQFVTMSRENPSAFGLSAVEEMITAAWDLYEDLLGDLKPYIDQELQKPEYKGKTLRELIKNTGSGDRIVLYKKILENAKAAKEKADREADAQLPALQSAGTPKYFTLINTSLTNAMQNLDHAGEIIGAGPRDLVVFPGSKRTEPTTIYVCAGLEPGTVIDGKTYTEYDRAIENAALSVCIHLAEKGMQPIATPEMIYRAATHRTASEKVTAQQKGSVTKSIDKLRRIYTTLNATDEISAKLKKEGKEPAEDGYSFENYLISAIKIKRKAGGKIVVAYFFYSFLQYEYAKLNGQYFTIKGDLLDIKKITTNKKDGVKKISTVSLPNSDYRIAMKNYLIRRIKSMTTDEEKAKDKYRKYLKTQKDKEEEPTKKLESFYNPKVPRVILFSSIFEAAEITAPNSQTRAKAYVYNVLEFWKLKGFITDYKKRQSRGKAPEAVTIQV